MAEKILLVGGGAREHAIATAIVRGGGDLYVVMKNRNPGIRRIAKDVAYISETDPEPIAAKAAEWGIGMAVVGSDPALAAGVTDALQSVGVKVASPTRRAAEIEWSKQFMREILARRDVPGQIRHRIFTQAAGLRQYLEDLGEYVVKPLGLTGGKGVRVSGEHLRTIDEGFAFAREIIAKGEPVLIEEKLDGEEISIQAFCDGTTAALMPAVQDHKRAFEGDRGPNTGGMGSYTDANGLLPFITKGEYEEAGLIVQRILDAMRAEDRPFVGTIYGQFMITNQGPKVIEVNARFGDPEAMNVLTMLESNYVDLMRAMVDGTLTPNDVRFSKEATVCKYIVPEGYGVSSKVDQPVDVDEAGLKDAGCSFYYASVNEEPGGDNPGGVTRVRTTSSRTLGIVGRGATLADAEAAAERGLAHVKSSHIAVRHDIGTAALIERRIAHMKRIRGQ